MIELNAVPSVAPDDVLQTVDIGPPNITYEGPQAHRDSRELISEMMKSVPQNGRVLDLGCGPRDQAKPMEVAGYQYLGADYSSPSADFLWTHTQCLSAIIHLNAFFLTRC